MITKEEILVLVHLHQVHHHVADLVLIAEDHQDHQEVEEMNKKPKLKLYTGIKKYCL